MVGGVWGRERFLCERFPLGRLNAWKQSFSKNQVKVPVDTKCEVELKSMLPT